VDAYFAGIGQESQPLDINPLKKEKKPHLSPYLTSPLSTTKMSSPQKDLSSAVKGPPTGTNHSF